MTTAGSLEGISVKNGKIKSITIHLSKWSRILPRQTKQFTRTCKKKYHTEMHNYQNALMGRNEIKFCLTDRLLVVRQSFFIRGSKEFFMAG